jgi:hypothetical protein
MQPPHAFDIKGIVDPLSLTHCTIALKSVNEIGNVGVGEASRGPAAREISGKSGEAWMSPDWAAPEAG